MSQGLDRVRRVPRGPAPVRLHTRFFSGGGKRHRRGRAGELCRGLCLGLSCLLSAPAASAAGEIGALPLDAEPHTDRFRLLWTEAQPPRAGSAEVARRPLETGGAWTILAPSLGAKNFYDDTTATPGTAWEYRVRRRQREILDQGYYAAGSAIPAIDHRGMVLLVTETGLSQDIAPELTRFAADLTGDGWHVSLLDGPSARDLAPEAELTEARGLRDRLIAQYETRQTDDETVAIILVGDLPLVKSGWVAPDGHAHQPAATDLFYADLDGNWPVNRNTPSLLAPSRLPGNGIETMIGRIDFSSLSPKDRAREITYLKDYFERNHAWRHGQWGDLRRAYLGSEPHLIVEGHGLDNIVGPDQVTPGGHHDVGEERRWLFGADFGHHKGANYQTLYAAKPVFAFNFGSNKQRIDAANNPMLGMMSAPNQALAVAWGSRPAWRVHGMALGRSIGDAQLRTANNRAGPDGNPDYMPTGPYRLMAPIWLNLLGDPTLHAFPVQPPADVRKERSDAGVVLNWTASSAPGLHGYRVYRAGPDGHFAPIGPKLITAQRFLDRAPIPEARYMVRALALKQVHAGSVMMLSQGIAAR